MRLAPLAIAVVVGAMLALGQGGANAQPGFPATYFGSVAIDGEPVPDGTDVRGFIDGIDCTQLGANYRTTITEDGVSQYAIEVVHESQREGCGDEGRTVTFVIGDVTARETAEWRPGATMLDLNGGSDTEPTLAPTTPTSTLEPTAAAATATEAAQFTPIAGTPPTGEVTLPVSTTEPGDSTLTPAPPSSGDDDQSGGGLLILGVVLVGLLILGVAGGTALGRRRFGKENEVDP